jgi:hypothetical protein
MSERDVDQWFSLSALGHVPLKLTEEERASLDLTKQRVTATYPHMTEMTVKDAPIHQALIFDEAKLPWTSFYSSDEAVVIFAFSDSRDAVEFRLRV